MQAVVAQQDIAGRIALTAETTELARVRQGGDLALIQHHLQAAIDHGVGPRLAVIAGGQGAVAVEEVPGPGDYSGAAYRVVAAGAFGAAVLGDHIGTVESVVEAAPAGVGGVEGIAGVHYRHHQLGPGEGGDFVVHVLGADAEVRGLRQQVVDLLQKRLVGGAVVAGTGVGTVPGVYLCLDGIALGEQRPVAGGEIVHDGIQSGPELCGRHAGAGGDVLFQQGVQFGGDAQAAYADAVGHVVSFCSGGGENIPPALG